MDIITNAKAYARDAHRGQKDDTGANYFKAHIEQVVQIIKKVTDDQTIIAAAYLHDTIEDAGKTVFDIYERFGPEVALLVYELTHEGKKDNEGYYFPRLRSRKAILIKFADRLSNLSRMEAWDEKRRAQYLRKSQFWSNAPKK